MNGETKLFLGILLATVLLIGGAVFAFSRPANTPSVDQSVLIAEDSYKLGSPSATVTMVEFGDFQCPACSAYHTVVKELMEKNKETLALVFRNFPLPSHANAMPSARAVEAAGIQGKFWEMYDLVYERQRDWSSEKDPNTLFESYAKELGLDVERFKKDTAGGLVGKRIENDVMDANALGINATPTFFVNGEKIRNPASVEEFDALIKAAAAKAPKPTGVASEASYHTHANITVVIDGKPIDFSEDKYQSVEGKELNESIHFHDGVGTVFHVHKKGMKLSDFFSSFGLTPKGKLYVNGKENAAFLAYEPQDLDRILITDGVMADVADDACIYSEKCPERGKPPSEECVGGLGTECK